MTSATAAHSTGASTAAPILELSDLTVRYGGLVAVSSVCLTVHPGQLVGLVGPNGAGKTTMIDAICGLAAAEGSVRFGGREVGRLAPHRRSRAGLVRTFQSIELFEDLTVRENVLVAVTSRGSRRSRRGSAAEIADRALQAVGLVHLRDKLPPELPQGQRKLAGVARALGSLPSCLLLDEPAGGLDSAESAALGRQLRALVDDGLSVLLIEHDMGLVFEVCDFIYVLEFGKVIAQGPPSTVRQDPRVIAAYLGEKATRAATIATGPAEESS